MKLILQKVTHAAIHIQGKLFSEMKGPGIVALAGFGQDDNEKVLLPALKKILELRVFPNDAGRFDKSLLDIDGHLMLVPQFTLYADTSKGRRPEFFSAKAPAEAKILFEKLIELAISERGSEKVATGSFGANMQVSLCNDGPVTIPLEITI